MALSENRIRSVATRAKSFKLSDGDGLYVIVTPSGGRLFRFDYTIQGKRRTLALGRWPAVSLRDARNGRDDAQRLLARGVDPCAEKQAKKRAAVEPAGDTFEQIALKWHALNEHRWSPSYAAQVLNRIEDDLFPDLGKKRLAQITRADILEALRRVEARGVLETARRLRQYIGAIYRFAGALDQSIVDPTPMLKGALRTPPRAKHHRTLLGEELGGFFLDLEAAGLDRLTLLAIQFTALTAARTNEARLAQWTEFEALDKTANALWRVPAHRMKRRRAHVVPLSKQAVSILAELRKMGGHRLMLFPGPGRDGAISNNTMLFAAYRAGGHGRQSIHGLRRAFSTTMNELGFPAEPIEKCLAHERDDIRSVYNAAEYLPKRRELLQAWADHLDQIKQKAHIAKLIG
jgi:integrase